MSEYHVIEEYLNSDWSITGLSVMIKWYDVYNLLNLAQIDIKFSCTKIFCVTAAVFTSSFLNSNI